MLARKTIVLCIPALFAASAAIAADDKTAAKATGDAEALAVVATVDRDEVALAKQAQTKKLSAGATEYAAMMQRDHSTNLAETQKLAKNQGAPSAKAAEIHKKDTKKKAELAPLDGAAYEKAYIDAMVKGHAEVLAKLDNELIPGAKDAAVKAHLEKTRGAVAEHLKKAEALQSK
jgi:putative membrane protein